MRHLLECDFSVALTGVAGPDEQDGQPVGTLFIAVGVVLFLPFVPQFARTVERFMPERGELVTQRLDDSLLSIPAVALEASQRALEEVTLRVLGVHAGMLSGSAPGIYEGQLRQAEPVLNDTYDFVSRVQLSADDAASAAQRIAQLHAIDHLLRFRTRLHDLAQAPLDLNDPAYEWVVADSQRLLHTARQGLEQEDLQRWLEELESGAAQLSERSRQGRRDLLQAAASDRGDPANALKRADTFRALDRMGHHIWRICHYLSQGRAGPHKAAGKEAQVEVLRDAG